VQRTCSDKEQKQTIGTSGLITVREKADLWAKIPVPDDDEPYQEFNCVQERLANISTRIFQAHPTCRLMFRTHLEKKQREYGIKDNTAITDVDMPEGGDDHDSAKQDDKRISGRIVKKTNFICFICNTKISKDTKPYADGGLGRCSEDRSFKKTIRPNEFTKCARGQI